MSQGQKEPSTYGPSWWDVQETLARLQDHTACRIEMVTRVCKDVRGQKYLYVEVRVAGGKRILGAANYARGSANASKTMAGAYYFALLRAESELDLLMGQPWQGPVQAHLYEQAK